MQKTILAISTSCLTAFFAFPALALTSPVIDEIDVLTPKQEKILEQTIFQIEEDTTAEIAIILPASLNGMEIRDYGREITDKLQIGKSDADNGLAIILAIPERKSAIETGYGTEGVITDILSKAMLEQIKPQLRAEDYNGALLSILSNSHALLAGDESIKSDLTRSMTQSKQDTSMQDGIIFPLALCWFFFIWKNKKKSMTRYVLFALAILFSFYALGAFVAIMQNIYAFLFSLIFLGRSGGGGFVGGGSFGGGSFGGGSSFGGFGGGGFGGGGASSSW